MKCSYSAMLLSVKARGCLFTELGFKFSNWTLSWTLSWIFELDFKLDFRVRILSWSV